MSNQDHGHFNEQWIMFILGPFFHFPFFIGIAMPLVMGLGGGTNRSNRFNPTPSYLVGWTCNTLAAYYYYYHGWF